MAVFDVIKGLCLRFALNKIVRPYLALLQVQYTDETIAKRRARLMELADNKHIRSAIAVNQRQLRLATLRGEAGDSIAAEMKSLAQDAVDELKGHLDTVASGYRGIVKVTEHATDSLSDSFLS